MLLLQKVALKRFLDVTVQERTFGDQGVNSLLCDLPRNSVDQEGVLDSIELTKHWILLEFFGVQDIHVCVNQKIQ